MILTTNSTIKETFPMYLEDMYRSIKDTWSKTSPGPDYDESSKTELER